MRFLFVCALAGTMIGIGLVGALRLAYPDFAALPAVTTAPASEIGGCGSSSLVGPQPSCAPGTTTGNARR